jgi:hypothetical protein
MNWLSRRPLPNDDRLALIRDTDRRNIGFTELGFGKRLARHIALAEPDLLRIMLNPPRLGIMLPKLALSDRYNFARSIENDGSRGSRALIEGEEMGHG